LNDQKASDIAKALEECKRLWKLFIVGMKGRGRGKFLTFKKRYKEMVEQIYGLSCVSALIYDISFWNGTSAVTNCHY
jgi:hypothetical protein